MASSHVTRVEMTAGAARHARSALLADLAELLEVAGEQVSELRDKGFTWPLVADARSPFEAISEAVEALDGLGWRSAVDAGSVHRPR